uniref:Zinc finger, CCHC-type n=1 Tax=Tanacetum cinerariifolium TaxID=118510 RepID=A0A6L2JUU4_TANCI|nr:zinc finger, CCHC-type [Tanacetum cinerariifolium]
MDENTMKDMTTNFGKLDKFEGHDFRRWQKKIHVLLTTLKVVYVLTTPMPELLEDATVKAIRIRILGQYTQHGLKIDESIFVSSIIDKLHPSWKDLKHTLKHGKDDLSLVQLGSHLRIEESLRAQDNDKGKRKEVGRPFVNMIEEGGKNKHHKQNKGKNQSNENNSGSSSNKKPKLECWKCDKTGHFKRDCRSGKKNNANAGGSGKGSKDQSQDQGSMALEFSSGKTITLFNVLYVPKLRKKLVSGPMLNKCGYKQVYESDKYILSKSGVFVRFGYYNNGMFMLNLNKVPDDSDSVYLSSSTVVNSSLWHARLGHVHYKRMLEMSKDNLIPAIDENLEKCTTCILTKSTRQPFKRITRKFVILELIHSDLCDFHATSSLGKKYVITFIDDASRFCYVYLLHAKDEALDKFRIFKREVELLQNDLIKTLCTDRGGEYYDFVFFQSVGTIHETTAPYTPQQNGVAERKNRALKEMVNSMLSYSGLSEGFWREAISKDIIPNVQESQMDDHTDDVPNEIPEPRKGKRVRKAKSYGSDFQLYLVEGSRDQVRSQYSYCYSIEEDPRTYNKAIQSRDDAFWKEAIDDEIGSIMKNNTWVLFDLPPGCKPLGCKWIFKRKMKVDGTIDKFKARLTSFLNGNLDKEVYMKQPEGFVMPGNEHKVCKLVKSLYGLKQAPKQWHQRQHWKAITRVFKYLRGTKDYGLSYVGYPSVLEGYSDASWINHVEGSSSTSGWVFLLGRGAILWASKKKTCITSSTMESEFVALAAAGKEAEWLRNLIHEIPIWPKLIAPISIRCDSAPTMAKAYSQIYNGKSRQLGVRHSIVRELIKNGVISIKFVRTQHNLADHLTNGLARDLVNKSVKGM